jgi:hypothetical protein
MFSLIFECARCGFGWSSGLIPEIRLGIVRVAWCRGSLLSRVEKWKAALATKLKRDEASSIDRPASDDDTKPGHPYL